MTRKLTCVLRARARAGCRILPARKTLLSNAVPMLYWVSTRLNISPFVSSNRVGSAVVTSQPWSEFTWAIGASIPNQWRVISVALATHIYLISHLFDFQSLCCQRLPRGHSKSYRGDEVEINCRVGSQPASLFSRLDTESDPPSGQCGGKKTVSCHVCGHLTYLRKIVAQTVWIGNFLWASCTSITLLVSCYTWGLPLGDLVHHWLIFVCRISLPASVSVVTTMRVEVSWPFLPFLSPSSVLYRHMERAIHPSSSNQFGTTKWHSGAAWKTFYFVLRYVCEWCISVRYVCWQNLNLRWTEAWTECKLFVQ